MSELISWCIAIPQLGLSIFRRKAAMLERRDMRHNFSVAPLFRNDPNLLIRPDAALSDIGKIIGVPSGWDFSDAKPFGCLLDYGDVGVEVWTRTNSVEIRRISVRLWKPVGGSPAPKTHRIRFGRHIPVKLNGFTPSLSADDAKSRLKELSINFKEESVDDPSEVVCRLLLKNKTELSFFNLGGNGPGLAEIHFFSTLRGA